MHRDAPLAELPRDRKPAVHLLGRQGVVDGEAEGVCEVGCRRVGAADGGVGDGEDEGVVEVAGCWGEKGVVASDWWMF
jgi:hypothetical protein